MNNWQTKKLSELTSKVGSGITPRGGSDVFIDEGVLFIRSQNIKNNKVDTTDRKYIPYSVDDKMRSSRVFSGDVLYNITGASIGRSAVYTLDEPANVNQHVCIVRLKDDNPKFVQYALSSAVGARNLWGFQAGGNREGLNFQQLGSFKINIPEKPEQEWIVGVLEVWDEYIEKLEQKIALKEQLKKGLMQQLLTGKRRLPGFSGEWNESRLSDIVDVKKGSGLSKEQLSNDGRKCILYGEIYTKYDEIIDEVQSRTATTVGVRSKVNDVLVPASTTTSSLDVATATHISEDDVLLGGDINILRPKTDTNGKFLALLLSGPEKINLAKRAQGITIVHLYGKDFVKMKVILPSKDEQDAIVGVIEAARREIKIMEPMLNELKLQKKYLLKNLITGTIRTPEDLKPLDTTRLERSAL